jgi:hypothetical protein
MLAPILAAALTVSAACDLERPSGATGCTWAAVDALKMNDIQVVGTHNSYKMAIAPKEFALVTATAPKVAVTLDYNHIALTRQLDDRARQLELDIVNDPGAGGLYAQPLGQKMVKDTQAYDLAPLRQPGFKVMHVPDIDYRSVCPLFTGCLSEIRAWSRAHPQHVPILILLNLKEDSLAFPGAVKVPLFDAAAMDRIDAEIRSVFPEADLITPDKVQDRYRTLKAAVAAGAWPTLKTARGKVMFALDAPAEQVARYRQARKVLEGRVMFVNADESSPAAGYITLNEPEALQARIVAAVRSGLIVRTRADADTAEARVNNRAPQAAAFASGAQYVSTDYMQPDPRFGPYETHLPGGGVARLSPSAPAR